MNNEPQRKVKHDVDVREVSELIKKLGKSAQKEFENYYIELMTEESLVKKLKIGNYKNTDDDKTKFLNSLGERIQERLEYYIVGEKKKQIDSKIKELKMFSNTYESDYYTLDNLKNDVEMGNNICYAIGELIGRGVGFAGMAAMGIPVILVSTLGVVLAELITVGINQINWEERFAKLIIKKYNKVSEKGVLSIYIESIGKYFDELRKDFEKFSEIAEKKHSDMLKEYERLADEKNMPQLRKKVEQLKTGIAFFSDLPLPQKA